MAVRICLLNILLVLELMISTFVHLSYGVTLFGSALWVDVVSFISRTPGRSELLRLAQSALGKWTGYVVEVTEELASSVQSPTIVHHNQEQESALGAFLDVHSKAPIVLVHGIFGFGKGKLGTLSYWGGAELRDDRVLVPDLGSLTGIHDRACELFYYLKGGTVDYGEEHSRACGHARFGRTYAKGHYSEWDENSPIHFVGHSTGAQVTRYLQQMLADKKFYGYPKTNADWVLSLTSLSGALNGTTRVHIDGIRVEDSRTIQNVCLLQLLRIGVLLYEWLDIPILKNYYSFGFDHFNLQWHKIGLRGLVNGLLGYSGPFASCEWILPDLSIKAAVELNEKLKTHPNTYYFSYATKQTRKIMGVTVPSSILSIHPLLLLRTFQISTWCHPSNVPLPHEAYRDEDWQENDGALNTKSMLYPLLPTPHPHAYIGSTDVQDMQTLQPGIWYYSVIEADHIYFIIDRERGGVKFDMMYDKIFHRCRTQLKRKSIEKALAPLPPSSCVEGQCGCRTDEARTF